MFDYLAMFPAFNLINLRLCLDILFNFAKAKLCLIFIFELLYFEFFPGIFVF